MVVIVALLHCNIHCDVFTVMLFIVMGEMVFTVKGVFTIMTFTVVVFTMTGCLYSNGVYYVGCSL